MRTPRYKTSFLQFCKNHQVEVKTQKWTNPNSMGFNMSTICKPTTASPRGSILFLHGAGTDRFFPSIQIQSEALSLGWQTICVDMDGHGAESTSRFDAGSSHQFLDCVFEHLKTEELYGPLHVLGVSMGGVMISEYLARNPDNNIKSIATWGSPLEISANIGSLLVEGMHVVHTSIWKHLGSYGIDLLPSMGPLRRKHLPFRSGSELNFLQSMLATIESKWEFLKDKNIPTPALHLRGQFDQLCKAESLQRWANIFPHSERRTYRRQSHGTIVFSEEPRQDTFKFFAKG